MSDKPRTRRATDADREKARMALTDAGLPIEDVENELNKFATHWNLGDCKKAMAKAGMDADAIEAALAETLPGPCELGETDETTDETEETSSQTIPITLTLISFSDDGEEAIVEDRHGNRGCLSTAGDFMHDSDSLSVGDTLLCDVLISALQTPIGILQPDVLEAPETEIATALEVADEDAEPPLLTSPHDVRKRERRETIEVTLKLTADEQLELAEEMAKALAERDRLESEFTAVKKDYKARIDLQVSAAAEAGATFRAGERCQEISCDVFEDRSTLEIVFCDSVTSREVYRRPMTHSERQCKLPLDPPAPNQDPIPPDAPTDTPRDESTVAPAATAIVNPHNCTNCGHFDQSSDLMPEPCQTCAQVESGAADNWTPQRICHTCAHVAQVVDLPPCSRCSLNADEAHRGDEDRWESKDAVSTPDQSQNDGEQNDDSDGQMPFVPAQPETASQPEA